MAQPESVLAKALIKQAYNASTGQGASALPWEDDSGPVSDKERYSQVFKFPPGQSAKARRTTARSWLFLESFEWCFGRKATVDNTAVLEEAMANIDTLPENRQFISPIEYREKIFSLWSAKMTGKLPAMPETPRARFVWHLRLAMPGWYSWAAGRSKAFTQWVQNDTKFEPDATLNCWEMVFFAAVKAGFLAKEKLAPAYTAAAGDAEKLLLETFKDNMAAYKASAKPPVLQAGDIIISSVGGPFHHVFAVAGQSETVEDLKVVQLWGEGIGAGTTFYWNMGEFLAFARMDPNAVYYVLKL